MVAWFSVTVEYSNTLVCSQLFGMASKLLFWINSTYIDNQSFELAVSMRQSTCKHKSGIELWMQPCNLKTTRWQFWIFEILSNLGEWFSKLGWKCDSQSLSWARLRSEITGKDSKARMNLPDFQLSHVWSTQGTPQKKLFWIIWASENSKWIRAWQLTKFICTTFLEWPTTFPIPLCHFRILWSYHYFDIQWE